MIPASKMASISSEVATGRRIKGRDGLIARGSLGSDDSSTRGSLENQPPLLERRPCPCPPAPCPPLSDFGGPFGGLADCAGRALGSTSCIFEPSRSLSAPDRKSV